MAARKADVDKAQVDVESAHGRLNVAKATANAWLPWSVTRPSSPLMTELSWPATSTRATFAQPAAGDPSAQRDNPAAARASSSPLYVVARIDKVRIFLDVPEMEANGIQPGSKAHVKIEALDNMEFSAEVTRTSWALNAKSRTLRGD